MKLIIIQDTKTLGSSTLIILIFQIWYLVAELGKQNLPTIFKNKVFPNDYRYIKQLS